MSNFYKVIRRKVSYNNRYFTFGEHIYATPEEISALLSDNFVEEVQESEVPAPFLEEISSGSYNNNSPKTLLGILFFIFSLLRNGIPILVNGRIPVDAGGGSGGSITGTVTANLGTLNGAATETTLQQVRDAVKAQIDIASSLWTDDSGAFYVRRDLISVDGGATIAFTTPAGGAATTGAGLRPLVTADKDILSLWFDVLTTGTGYTAGDILMRVAILDVNTTTPALTYTWLNFSQGTVLGSAPVSSHIERADETVGARQVGNWIVSIGDSSSSIIGAVNEAAPGTDTASSGLNGRLQRLAQRITSLIGLLPTSLGSKTAANSLAVTLSSDGAFATSFGLATDSAASTNIANTGFISLFKRFLDTYVVNWGTLATPWFTKSKPFSVSAIFTKAANANAYTINDVFGTKQQLSNFGSANSAICILSVRAVFSSASLPSGMGSFKLFFFNSDPTAIADNAAFTIRDASMTSDGVTLNTLTASVVDTKATSTTIPSQLALVKNSSDLVLYLVTLGAFTPLDSTAATITITIEGIEL